jgi:AcrR family transcriptional regulator
MPRARGQIDLRKSEAILQAAFEVLSERGLNAPLEEVARRAKVSKQTVYNHFGSKAQLVRQLIDRRRAVMTEALSGDGVLEAPEATLEAYAVTMIHSVLTEPYGQLMRLAVNGSQEMPELTELVYETALIGARDQLATYLAKLMDRGVMRRTDASLAAEMFAGMACGGLQMRVLTQRDLASDLAAETQRGREAARLFLYGMKP